MAELCRVVEEALDRLTGHSSSDGIDGVELVTLGPRSCRASGPRSALANARGHPRDVGDAPAVRVCGLDDVVRSLQ